jgi:hypothetical protein
MFVAGGLPTATTQLALAFKVEMVWLLVLVGPPAGWSVCLGQWGQGGGMCGEDCGVKDCRYH